VAANVVSRFDLVEPLDATGGTLIGSVEPRLKNTALSNPTYITTEPQRHRRTDGRLDI